MGISETIKNDEFPKEKPELKNSLIGVVLLR